MSEDDDRDGGGDGYSKYGLNITFLFGVGGVHGALYFFLW
jgi:hypothetical protein